MCTSEHQQEPPQKRPAPENPPPGSTAGGSAHPAGEGVQDPRLVSGQDLNTSRFPLSIEETLAGPLGAFLKDSFDAARMALDELERIMTVMAQDASDRPEVIIRDPRIELLKAVLKDAVEVLEKTKYSFKSKDLGALRKRLQQCIEYIEKDPQYDTKEALRAPAILFEPAHPDRPHRNTRED